MPISVTNHKSEHVTKKCVSFNTVSSESPTNRFRKRTNSLQNSILTKRSTPQEPPATSQSKERRSSGVFTQPTLPPPTVKVHGPITNYKIVREGGASRSNSGQNYESKLKMYWKNSTGESNDVTKSTTISSEDRKYVGGNLTMNRSMTSTSPLAQYGNDITSLFCETTTRIFRTPIKNSCMSPRLSLGTDVRPLATDNKRYSVPSTSVTPTSDAAYAQQLRKYISMSDNSIASGRKSALRRVTADGTSSSCSSPVRLRVRFAKSCDQPSQEQPKKDIDIENEDKAKENSTLKDTSPRNSDIITSAKSLPNGKASVSAHDSQGDTETSEISKNSSTSNTVPIVTKSPVRTPRIIYSRGTTPIKQSISAKFITSRKHSDAIPHLRHRRSDEGSQNSWQNNYNTSASEGGYCVLTPEQLLMRKSVEKVQRWIKTLPNHFNAICPVLPPVQQDY